MISAIVLTKNEEKNIAKCIKSLLWANEIILIDDFSADNTISIAKKLGAKVYRRHLNNDFAAQRNFGLSKAKEEWILFIDADEEITRELKKEILNLKLQNYSGFYLKRRDIWLRKALSYGEVGNTKLLRFAKKNSGKWNRKVHEYWHVNGNIGKLQNPILHYPHQSIKEFIESINKYSIIHSQELKKENKKSSLVKIIFWPLGKFFVNYFLKLGFLDGVEGFIIAGVMSFHSFLSWSKAWMD